MDWYFKVLKSYAVFDGRARRKEFWIFVSYCMVGAILFAIADNLLGSYLIAPVFDYEARINNPGLGLLTALHALVLTIPALAVLVRRLHDSGRNGAWLLIGMLPIAGFFIGSRGGEAFSIGLLSATGFFVLLCFLLRDSSPGTNRYGDNPKSATT